MNTLLQMSSLGCLDSLEHILGIDVLASSSSGASEDSYQYGNDNLIYETYQWAWSDNHKDNLPSSIGFTGPVQGMIQARIQQQTRIKPYLNILLQSNHTKENRFSQNIGSKKRIRKNTKHQRK